MNIICIKQHVKKEIIFFKVGWASAKPVSGYTELM